MKQPTPELLTKCHFYAWGKGLKTGSYYIRSNPAMTSQSVTIDPKDADKYKQEECLNCGS